MKLKQVYALIRRTVLNDCRELIFAECSEETGSFLILYRDEKGKRCSFSFRREEEER